MSDGVAGERVASEAHAGGATDDPGEASAGERVAGERIAREVGKGEAAAGERLAGERVAREAVAIEVAAGERAAGERFAGEVAGEVALRERIAGEAAAGERAAGEGGRRMRADAQRNREKLLAAAAAAFSHAGVDTSLEGIAKAAGVGAGTLYRHFPTREALIEAVYRHEVEALVSAAATLGEEMPLDEALGEWMQRFVGYIATKRGMKDSLRLLMESNSPLFAEVGGLMPQAFRGLMEKARAAGAIRPDADSADVLLALSSIWSASDGPDWQERSRRVARLIMDGLRYNAPRAPG